MPALWSVNDEKGGFAMIQKKEEQLERVRRAFRNPDLRGWIPNCLLTVLEQGEDTEHTLLKMEQVMPKYCVPRRFETEESQSLDEGSLRIRNMNSGSWKKSCVPVRCCPPGKRRTMLRIKNL